MFAKDIMTSPVTTIAADQNVRRAIEVVNSTNIGAIPVVDDSDELIGIITEGDLLRRISSHDGRRSIPHNRDRHEALEHYIKARSWRIRDVMTFPVISALPTATITQVADLLLAHSIRHIPVVADGRLVGMISRRDVMRAILDLPRQSAASGDEALCVAIRARLESDLAITAQNVESSVENGHVFLRGEVEDPLEKDAARVAAESVPGVQGVTNDIKLAQHMFSRMKPPA